LAIAVDYWAQAQASQSQTSHEQVWPSQSGHLQTSQPQLAWADLAVANEQQAGAARAAISQPQPVHSQMSQLQVVPLQSGQRQTSQPQPPALLAGAA
jgi:hypothetical protein